MVMGQGRLFHPICLHFLLIATAIQGVTPDAHDLASIKALCLFCPALADSSSLGDDDDLPDDVCRPAQSEMDLTTRGRANSDDPCFPAFAWTEPRVRTIRSNAIRSSTRSVGISRIDDPIGSMCRINC
jgi:hypothetical protein